MQTSKMCPLGVDELENVSPSPNPKDAASLQCTGLGEWREAAFQLHWPSQPSVSVQHKNQQQKHHQQKTAQLTAMTWICGAE